MFVVGMRNTWQEYLIDTRLQMVTWDIIDEKTNCSLKISIILVMKLIIELMMKIYILCLGDGICSVFMEYVLYIMEWKSVIIIIK
jgi:hypothetical protein